MLLKFTFYRVCVCPPMLFFLRFIFCIFIERDRGKDMQQRTGAGLEPRLLHSGPMVRSLPSELPGHPVLLCYNCY